jgi:hypothetical protein
LRSESIAKRRLPASLFFRLAAMATNMII